MVPNNRKKAYLLLLSSVFLYAEYYLAWLNPQTLLSLSSSAVQAVAVVVPLLQSYDNNYYQ